MVSAEDFVVIANGFKICWTWIMARKITSQDSSFTQSQPSLLGYQLLCAAQFVSFRFQHWLNICLQKACLRQRSMIRWQMNLNKRGQKQMGQTDGECRGFWIYTYCRLQIVLDLCKQGFFFLFVWLSSWFSWDENFCMYMADYIRLLNGKLPWHFWATCPTGSPEMIADCQLWSKVKAKGMFNHFNGTGILIKNWVDSWYSAIVTVHSLKITVRHWKWMVGILVSF